ncbi:MAG: sigma 54-interacting transcriptional regulator [Spirochaetes bacterium]|nr:sigma 54-interacting transcriptional regulator [Spirochaetota bacterium]
MSNDVFKEYIDLIPSGIIFFNEELIITDHNIYSENLIEVSGSKLSGMHIKDLSFYKDKSGSYRMDYKKCMKDNSDFNGIVYLKNNDNLIPVFISLSIVKTREVFAVMSVSNMSKTTDCERFINDIKKDDISSFQNIVGNDKKMAEIFKLIELAADSDSNVLIYGESGTGKELIAKAIHNLSPRNTNPFITVNCSALSETLLESELFGHIKGSFTGAYKDKIGKFEASHQGTIFLDEIGDISPLMQLKLLRVIQEKTIVKVGDNNEIKVDMRIITATNKNLRELVSSGTFREDLFYRLKVFAINTVPLREHKNDIPLLVDHFISQFNKKTGKSISGLTENATRLIMDYCWPGNVRELENTIEHAFVVCSEKYIDIFDLPQELRLVGFKEGICKEKENTIKGYFDASYYEKNKAVLKPRDITSKEKLLEILKDNNFNKSETARQLGISRIALWKKLKKYGIDI